MDSHVLLHLLANLHAAKKIAPVRAIHIDHGLQTIAATWGMHCEKTAQQLGIACECISLNLQINKGDSLEAVARQARYKVFSQQLKCNEILLTAHHQNDQAETVLLQLFRGAGVDGLAAMPEIKPFQQGQLLRPLLAHSRQEITDYATQHRLDYIDDPSNINTDFDRNFLRQDILPLLQQRWKGITGNLSRVAALQAEAKQLLAQYTQVDLQQAQGKIQNTLTIQALLAFSSMKQKAIIRLWLQQLHIRMPSAIKLQHILSDVLYARQDATPCVHWDKVEMRRYKSHIYVMPCLSKHDTQQIIMWDDRKKDVWIESLQQSISAHVLTKLLQHRPKGEVSIRFRQGGEALILNGNKSHTSLKKLFYNAAYPYWERNRVPLIYLDNTLIMVYPHWSAAV
jgi:tRNA(Ile)-lysidine synthase